METNVNQKSELSVAETSQLNPSALLHLAVQQNFDIEKLEKLLQLQRQWQEEIERREFLSAISNFQFQCPPLEKTKKVAFGNTKYSYAPLGEIESAIKKAMRENGLSKRWEIEDTGDKIICTCIISHLKGHSEKTTMHGSKDSSGGKNEIQQRGSTISYLQRYTLIAALGISTADEDLDGKQETKPDNKNETGNNNNQSQQGSQQQQPQQPERKVIPESWLKKSANCKEPEDIETIYANETYNKTIAANIELQEMFNERRETLWKEKLAKCNTAEEVDALGTRYKDVVNKYPEIRKLFVVTKDDRKKNPRKPADVDPGNTTSHNHTELKQNGKPLISNELFKTAKQQIELGELDVYYKTINDFSLESTQADLLRTAYETARDAKKK